MLQAVIRCLPIVESLVQSQVNPHRIFGRPSGAGKDFSTSSSLRLTAISIIPPAFHSLLRLHATDVRTASGLKLGACLQNISFVGKKLTSHDLKLDIPCFIPRERMNEIFCMREHWSVFELTSPVTQRCSVCRYCPCWWQESRVYQNVNDINKLLMHRTEITASCLT